MNNCKYEWEWPKPPHDGKVHCNAYSHSKRKDGRHWAHFPECKEENCPLIHPELLGDAVLETEGQSK